MRTSGAFSLGNITASNTGGTAFLAITSAGNISQAGSTAITATQSCGATFNAGTGGGTINLSNANNDFGVLILNNFNNTAGNTAATVTDINGLTPFAFSAKSGNAGNVIINAGGTISITSSPAFTLGSGNITLQTTSGSITQQNSTGLGIVTTGNLTAITTDVNGNVTLIGPANNIGGTVTLSGKNVAITNAAALNLGNITGTATFTALTSAANGNITQSGVLNITGTSSVNAGTGNINLSNTGNAFTGAISSTGTNITLTTAGNIILGATNAGGTLNVSTTNGTINQSDVLNITGTTTLATGNSNVISLTNASNSFTGTVSSTGGSTSLRINGALILGNITASNTGGNAFFSATSAGNISQAVGTAITATQSGGAAFNAGTGGGTINLSNANNDFSVLTLNNFNNTAGNTAATVTDINGLTPFAFSAKSGNAGNVIINAGGTISITSSPALQMGAGNVTLQTTSGSITETNTAGLGIVTTGNLTAITTDVNGNITLIGQGNNIGGSTTLTGKNVAITNGAALNLGNVTATGTFAALTSAANGNITQSGTLNITGTSSINAGTGSITLNSSNAFGQAVTVGPTSGTSGAVSLTAGAGGLSLIQATGGTLGSLSATTTGTFTAGSNLSTAISSTTGDLSLTGNTLSLGANTINSGHNLSLTSTSLNTPFVIGSTLTTANNLSVTTNNGVISQSALITVPGTTTLNAGSANINLANPSNAFTGAVSVVSGGTTTLKNAGALTLGAITTSGPLTVLSGAGGTGALVVGGAISTGTQAISLSTTGNSNISDNSGVGSISNSGGVVLDAGTGTISLTNAANSFGTTNSVTLGHSGVAGGAVTLGANSSGIKLAEAGSSLASLNVTTNNGAIAQSGALTISGTTTLTTGTGNISLTNTSNAFTGAVGVVSGGTVGLTNPGALTLGAITTSGPLTVVSGAGGTGALVVGGAISTGAQAISLSTTGNNNISDNSGVGSISNSGGVVLNAGTGTISLTNAANSFGGGTVTVGSNAGNSGAVTLTAGSGGLKLAQAAGGTLDSLNATTTGTFTANTNLSTSSNLSLTGSTVTLGANTLNSGNDLNITETGSGVGFAIGNNLTIGNNLSITTNNGAITQTAALNVLGTSSFNSGTANITVNNASNNFTGGVGITSGNNVSLTNSGALSLAASTVSGTLGVTTTGAITQSGILNISGASTLNAGANAITLGNASNVFGGTVTVGPTSGTSGAVTLASGSGGLTVAQAAGGTLGSLSATTTGTLTAGSNLNTGISSTTGDLSLTGSTLSLGANTLNSAHNLSLTSTNLNTGFAIGSNLTTANNLAITTNNGAITQTAAITTPGTITLNSGTAAITLNNASNAFTGAVISTGSNISLTNNRALVLGATTATGTFGAIAAGAITQSGILNVTGATTLAAGSGNNITLTNASNTFTGGVGITSGNNVSLANSGALSLAGSTVSGTLGVTTTGAMTQSGILNITGATTLAAGSDNNITLTNASNTFTGGVGITSGNNVSLTNSGALSLAASTVSGTLGVTTTGAITQSGALAVTGATTLAAGSGNNITLTNASNTFTGGVGITSGNNVSLTNSGALSLAASTVSGTLGVTITGAITQTGALTVSGLATFNAGSNNITLNTSTNNFNNVALTGGTIGLADANNFGISGISASGDLTLLAQNGNITFNDGTLPIALTGPGTQTATLVASTFTNNYAGGASPINVGSGTNSRWLFYLTNLAGNTFGTGANALVSGNQAIWGTSYPTAVAASGNRYIFATTPTLSLTPLSTPFAVSKTYGSTATLPTPSASSSANYQTSGFVNASTYGNVFTQDTVSNVSISGLSYTSTGAAGTANVTGSPYVITITGTGSNTNGYGIAYNNASTFGQLTVNQASLTISSLIAQNRTYNATTNATLNGTATLSGTLHNGDNPTLSGSATTGTFASANVANGIGVTANLSGLSLTGTGAGNYQIIGVTTPLTANITPAPLTIGSLVASNKVYNSTTAASLTGTGVLAGTQYGSDNVTLNGSNPTAGTFASANVANGIGVTANLSGLSLTGTGASNYQIIGVTTPLTANITPAPLTIGSLVASNKVYNATTTAALTGTGALTGTQYGSDNVTLTGTNPTAGTFASANVGNGIGVTANLSGLSLTGTGAGNYQITGTTSPLTANITPASLTINNLVASNKVYNATTAASLTGTGVLAGTQYGSDNVILNGTNPTAGIFADANVGNGIGVTANLSGLSLTGTGASNYAIIGTTSPLSANITPAPLTINNLGAVSRGYNATTTADLTGTGVLAGTQYGSDNVTLNGANPTAGTFASPNAGNGIGVIANLSGLSLTGAGASNYALIGTTTPLTANISQAPLTISGLSAQSRSYDATALTNLTGTGVIAGTVYGSDNPTLSGSSPSTGNFVSPNVGNNLSVNANLSSLALTGTGAENYTIVSVTTPLVANITAAPLTINNLMASNKVYNATNLAGLTGTGVLAGTIYGSDNVTLNGTNPTSGTFATANAGNGIGVTANLSGLSLTGTGSSNYQIIGTTSPLTANITAAPLTISNLVASNKVYDANTLASIGGTASLAGTIYGSDSVNLSGTSPTSGLFADKNVANNIAVSTNISGLTLSGSSAGNYQIVGLTSPLAADITPASLSLNAVSSSKVYNAMLSSDTPVSVIGLQGSDTISNLSQRYLSKNVLGADGSTLVVNNGYVLNDGNNGNNYIITTNSAPGTITPASLIITANNASREINTPNPIFTATYTGFQGMDSVSNALNNPLVLSTPAIESSPVGDYAIIPSNATAQNYTIAFVNGVLTVTGVNPNPPVPPIPTPNENVVGTNPALYGQQVQQNIMAVQNGVYIENGQLMNGDYSDYTENPLLTIYEFDNKELRRASDEIMEDSTTLKYLDHRDDATTQSNDQDEEEED